MKLMSSIYVVGSGEFMLTDDPSARPFYDCHIYLIDGGSQLAIIDAGYGDTVAQVVANIERWGLDPGLLSHCLLTHAHHDHARGAAAWQERGLQIIGSEPVARELADPGVLALAYSCPDGTFPPCRVDRIVDDGGTIRIGSCELTALMTPGHSSGDVAYYLRPADDTIVLFVGDTMQSDGVSTDLGYPLSADRDIAAHARSLYRLFQLRPDVLLPAHGMLALGNGYRWLGQALHAVNKIGMLE